MNFPSWPGKKDGEPQKIFMLIGLIQRVQQLVSSVGTLPPGKSSWPAPYVPRGGQLFTRTNSFAVCWRPCCMTCNAELFPESAGQSPCPKCKGDPAGKK